MQSSGHVSSKRRPLPGGATLVELTGQEPGPTVALLGGVHGDEDEGVLAVHRALEVVAGQPLAGTLRAVAPAHPAAWAAQSRTSPLDGENLARCFPGDHDDVPTKALAAGIAEEVITGADVLIDLHSAGVRYAMPLFCGFCRQTKGAEESERVAEAFGAPLVWVHPRSAPGRSVSVAHELGIPAVYAECSGGGGIRADELDTYVNGVLSVMAEWGMLAGSFRHSPEHLEPRRVYGSGDLDQGAQASSDGFFVSSTSAGAVVAGDNEIGRLYDFTGRLLDVVTAPWQGAVMFLRRQARVRTDDVLYVLARLEDE